MRRGPGRQAGTVRGRRQEDPAPCADPDRRCAGAEARLRARWTSCGAPSTRRIQTRIRPARPPAAEARAARSRWPSWSPSPSRRPWWTPNSTRSGSASRPTARRARQDDDDKGKDDDTLKAEYRAIAERRVRLGLLLAEIGRANNITVSPDEMIRAMRAEASRFPGQETAGDRVLPQEPAPGRHAARADLRGQGGRLRARTRQDDRPGGYAPRNWRRTPPSHDASAGGTSVRLRATLARSSRSGDWDRGRAGIRRAVNLCMRLC